MQLPRLISAIREQDNVHFPEVVHTIQTGKRGRPRKWINPRFLRMALSVSNNISITALAEAIHVSRKTVYRYMKLFGISRQYSPLTDGQIDVLLQAYRLERPTSGIRYIMGFLRERGLRVQRQKVVESLHRVDGSGQSLRRYIVIKRRCYRVPRPNALWHLDGHHKLNRWGFVIHGIIDGFCRTVSRLGELILRTNPFLCIDYRSACQYK